MSLQQAIIENITAKREIVHLFLFSYNVFNCIHYLDLLYVIRYEVLSQAPIIHEEFQKCFQNISFRNWFFQTRGIKWP